jgi:RNA polymerase sigma-70 factor (ECF subfamily)
VDGPPIDVAALWDRYGPMVLRRCRTLLREEEEAMDVCQDVFVRVLERRADLRAEFPSSLLYRMATNLCLNRIRDRGRAAQPTDDSVLDAIARADDTTEKSLANLILNRVFGRHPESSRTIAVLHHVDGLTLEEVAKEVSMSVSGVRKRLRALRMDPRRKP